MNYQWTTKTETKQNNNTSNVFDVRYMIHLLIYLKNKVKHSHSFLQQLALT